MDVKQKTRISLKSLFNDLPDFNILDLNLNILITLLLGIALILIVFYQFIRSKSKKNSVAILGLCGSGKTLLFSYLCYGVNVLSVTSIKESSGYFTSDSSKKLLIHDIPGHDRIRYSLFDKVKSQIKGLIFLLDAATFQEDIKDVAEFLYTVFCDGIIQSCRPSVLIVCNKQDLLSAKGAGLIKSSLEKEMNLLRVTKANQLKSVGEGENNNTFLGFQGQDFQFSHLKYFKITFAESVATEGSQISDIKTWLEKLM